MSLMLLLILFSFYMYIKLDVSNHQLFLFWKLLNIKVLFYPDLGMNFFQRQVTYYQILEKIFVREIDLPRASEK